MYLADSVMMTTSQPDFQDVIAALRQLFDDRALLARHKAFAPFFLQALFDDLRRRREGVLLAVSGGPDSIGLVMLCHAWQCLIPGDDGAERVPLYLASVDHGLRKEAKDEADYVAALAKGLGLPHQILSWEEGSQLKDTGDHSNLQARARAARYELLGAHARTLGVKTLVTAHHLDDQAETFVMRLLRGSSVRGLAAMSARRSLDDLELVRPLLGTPKEALTTLLNDLGLSWCEDPSNEDRTYNRVAVRKELLPHLAEFGADADHLARTARRMARAEAALDSVARDLFDRHMVPEPGRALSCALADFCSIGDEFRLRLLQAAIFHVAGEGYPCREQRLLHLDKALQLWKDESLEARKNQETGAKSRKRTLAGCCFEISQGRLWIYREIGRLPFASPLGLGEACDYLSLAQISVTGGSGREKTLVLRPLGEEGRLILADHGYSRRDNPPCITGASEGAARLLPAGLIDALPSVWGKNGPIAVMDWPEIEHKHGFALEIREKNTRFTKNAAGR